MKVLLTGANGFVGSHVLDRLLAGGLDTRILLRRGSDTGFITSQLARAEVCHGGFDDPVSLRAAVSGVTHVVHCAGATKALSRDGLLAVNQHGTRNLVDAVNSVGEPVQRMLYLSSLAAGGPGTRDHPAREDAVPRPLSAYGESKLAGERAVAGGCRRDFTILRPAGVYGPRDREFLRLFRTAAAGMTPVFGGGQQELRLVFARDLAVVVVQALSLPGAAGQVINVAADEVTTAAELAESIAAVLRRRTVRLPLPWLLLNLVCTAAGISARLTRKPSLLALGKYRELAAPGWVADTGRLRALFGPVCSTGLRDGLQATRDWYRKQGWIR